MSYYNSKRNIAHAAAALGVGFSGAAQAGTTTSKAPVGYTPLVFRVGSGSGSFDPSGTGLDVINVTSTRAQAAKQPSKFKPSGKAAKPAKLTFSSQSVSTGATIASDSSNFAAAYAVLPDIYAGGGSGPYMAKDARSNYTTTPMFGQTRYSTDGGTTQDGFGYFQGTYDGTDFTLLDYGVFTPAAIGAAPEPETWALLALGFGGIGAMRRRQRRKQRPVEAIAV